MDVEHRGAGAQKRPLLAGPEAAQKASKWQETFKLVLKMTSLWLARWRKSEEGGPTRETACEQSADQEGVIL